MNNDHQVRIEDDGIGHGRVNIDGLELNAVSYIVEGGAESIQRVTVTFNANVMMEVGGAPAATATSSARRQDQVHLRTGDELFVSVMEAKGKCPTAN